MQTLIIFLGVLLLLTGMTSVVMTTFIKRSQKFLLGVRGGIFGSLAGLLVIIIGSSLVHVKAGQIYVVYTPFGGKTVHSTTGLKFIMIGSQIQKWDKIIDIKTIPLDREGNLTQSTDGIEGVIRGGIPIRFIDQVTGEVYISVRMQMPESPDEIIQLVEDFRHPANLVNNTLVPTVREQIINTGYMYAAQDYISGAASDFRLSIDDQLKNGGLSVEKREIFDTVYANIQVEGDRQIKEINTRYEVEIRENGGKPIRIPHDITKNAVLVAQVIVDNVLLEEAFRERLEKQRDIASQKRVEMEAIELAKISQQKIIAEGERDKAAERVNQEKEQVSKLIAIETRLKQEQTNKELAEIQLETEKFNAQKKKVAADAQYYENAKLVAAGLTPQERVQYEKEIAIGVAEKIAQLKLPQIYMAGGSDKNNSSILSDLLGAEIAKKMLSPN